MRQTNVNRVSVVFIEMLVLSCFILCLRFRSSAEKIGRCRKLCSFYFQNCMFSAQAFMESKKTWWGVGGGVSCFLALETAETDKHLDL